MKMESNFILSGYLDGEIITRYEIDFINNYIVNNFIYNDLGHFHSHYKKWTVKRLNKILEIFSLEEFEGKRILILGVGNFRGFFASIGAKVLVLEGKIFNINMAKLRCRNLKNITIKKFDLNTDFSEFGKFDFIINFGLIEVINDVGNLLKCCAIMSSTIIFETLVCDSLDKKYIAYKTLYLKGIDNGIKGQCSRPSPFFIEKFFESGGFKTERYFDENLNMAYHNYTWKHKNDKSTNEDTRRFWIFKEKIKTNN